MYCGFLKTKPIHQFPPRSKMFDYCLASETSVFIIFSSRQKINAKPIFHGCTERFMQTPQNFRLHFRYAYTIIYAMKNKSSKKVRSRAEILAEIAALPPSIQGTISSYKCPRKNGPPAVYYNLQYTLNGRNHSKAIPVGMVAEFKDALASGKKLKDLVLELSDADTRLLVEQSSALKKSSRTSS